MKFENIYKEADENMRLALLSLWTPGSHPMRPAIEELLKREPLFSEPVFQSTFGWEAVDNDEWRNFLDSRVIEKLEIGNQYSPYKHQASSWKALYEEKSIVVTSGTGSGKTECFMYPVISDLVNQDCTNAIEAIFLYPLNALMEDQKKRLNKYCEPLGLRFAVYNGDTPNDEREEIRQNSPEILLTNPSMLEYILVRPKDQQMLQNSAGKLRWIIIDEAHSYSGSAAVELAYQIKRILEAFNTDVNNVRFACTSATIGGEDGVQSLKEFIATITGQTTDRIEVIGGNRLVKSLDENRLERELQENNLPSKDLILSLRNKINNVSGMTLQQIWEWLYPDIEYNKTDFTRALQLIDRLCEMSQDGVPILSLRGHFFMRTINGLYACANPKCNGSNTAQPIYGHLTTYKSSACPQCGAPLLEIVQCKRCGGFVLVGTSTRNEGIDIVSSFDGNVIEDKDYFDIDTDDENVEDDENIDNAQVGTFFLMPYQSDRFFNPIADGNVSTINLLYDGNNTILQIDQNEEGQWVEVKNDRGASYCPSCGKLAQGRAFNFKHFRIPIRFVNQVVSPILLKETATDGRHWGKYIAFTDSRQGTAISAKTFNIDVERTKAREQLVERLMKNLNKKPLDNLPEDQREIFANLSENTIRQVLENLGVGENRQLSLNDVSDCIFTKQIFSHITDETSEQSYKAALLRQNIARKTLYENSMENMGLIKLVYPSLNNINKPNSVTDYEEIYNIEISEQDWQDFLKISLDYFFRLGNHLHPLVEHERGYLRESSIGRPVFSPNDARTPKWPQVSDKHRLVLLLCAGLGISDIDTFNERQDMINNIMNDAWNNLVNNGLIRQVNINDTDGYNNPLFYRGDEYVGAYYLDLSKDTNVCKIELTTEVKECPVTGKLLDTTFRGYSPLITGQINKRLFDKYRCSDETIRMPMRPGKNGDVDEWLRNDERIQYLKEHGFWSDRYKYTYKKLNPYLAAEHSAQQSKDLLRTYVQQFTAQNPAINVLHCSTTMEMGVDIGDIDIVLMDTIPPTAANYLQRVGRAGRMGQTKSVAFSLCNNTLVGQSAFENPMWALQTTNHMAKVRPSQTIIQRHINSFFFRKFVTEQGLGVTTTVGDFMVNNYSAFIEFLNRISTNNEYREIFQNVFGYGQNYTVNITLDNIRKIHDDYNCVIEELRDALENFADNNRRNIAISNQIEKIQNGNLLIYLSQNQFIPNANMPTGIVTFDFMTSKDAATLRNKNNIRRNLRENLNDNDLQPDQKIIAERELDNISREIDNIQRSKTASRDVRTALNEYAPGQTIVVNERNYVSAGVLFFGVYNEQTQARFIYHCRSCGHTEYRENLEENATCPVCRRNYKGIIDELETHCTLAYEPIGFRTDQNVNETREERTQKEYYDIRPVLLETNWNDSTHVNMCDVIKSGDTGRILFYNLGHGSGFAFCKRCGRAAIDTRYGNIPEKLAVGENGHKPLLRDNNHCDANENDIARHVVFTGYHSTCYSVLRFKKNIGSDEYERDEQLVYSLGVVLRRALAKLEGIDEGEIDFGVKKERNATVLFIYDTAKGGCGYSLRFNTPDFCQRIIDIARNDLENSLCDCHNNGDKACTKCLIDSNSSKYLNKLSKAKVLDWLNKQKNIPAKVPVEILEDRPNAQIVYQSLKEILKRAVNNTDVTEITLCVSDLADNYTVTDWTSVHSEMGKYINDAVRIGKNVSLKVEYHPELYSSLTDKLSFIGLNDKFTDCNVSYIRDMGALKTAIIVKTGDNVSHYFTNMDRVLSFSNNWGNDCAYVFEDESPIEFAEQEEPTYNPIDNGVVIREGITRATSFQVKNYFTEAIAKYVLQPDDIDILKDVLWDKHVNIVFSDMYVNSALASLMLVYLINEMKSLFNFTIDDISLQLDSPRRKCNNDRFNEYSFINLNFPNTKEADEYTDRLFNRVLGVDPEHLFEDADHHRWLKIETNDGGLVEIRPDHGISGGYRSSTRYMNIETLNGTVRVDRDNQDVLYYVIIKRGNN